MTLEEEKEVVHDFLFLFPLISGTERWLEGWSLWPLQGSHGSTGDPTGCVRCKTAEEIHEGMSRPQAVSALDLMIRKNVFLPVHTWAHAWLLSHAWLFVTPWTVTHQPPLSMGLSRQEYWSWLPFPSPGIFPTQGLNLSVLCHLRCHAGSLPLQHRGRSTHLKYGSQYDGCGDSVISSC